MEKKSLLNKIEVELTIEETMMIAEALRIVNSPDFYQNHFSERLTIFEEQFNSGLQKMNKAFVDLGFLTEP